MLIKLFLDARKAKCGWSVISLSTSHGIVLLSLQLHVNIMHTVSTRAMVEWLMLPLHIQGSECLILRLVHSINNI